MSLPELSQFKTWREKIYYLFDGLSEIPDLSDLSRYHVHKDVTKPCDAAVILEPMNEILANRIIRKCESISCVCGIPKFNIIVHIYDKEDFLKKSVVRHPEIKPYIEVISSKIRRNEDGGVTFIKQADSFGYRIFYNGR